MNGPYNNGSKQDKVFEYIRMIFQFGILIWGAALIYSRVGQLSETVTTLTSTITTLETTMSAMQIQGARLEVRLDNIEARERSKP